MTQPPTPDLATIEARWAEVQELIPVARSKFADVSVQLAQRTIWQWTRDHAPTDIAALLTAARELTRERDEARAATANQTVWGQEWEKEAHAAQAAAREATARAEAAEALSAVLQGRVDMLEHWVAVLGDALTAYMEPAGDTPEELREQARRALAGEG